MKQLTLIFFLFCSILFNTQAQQVNLVSDVWPPFTNKPSEKRVALNLVEVALQRIGVKSSFTISNFEGLIESIETNIFDGSAALWKTSEREETMVFSRPYLQNQLVLVGLKETYVSFSHTNEIKNGTIGLVTNYAYDLDLSESENIEIVYSENDQRNIEKLLDGEIDYMLVDNLLIQYLLENQLHIVKEKLAIGEHPLQIKTLHFALNKEVPNAERITILFNNEIELMIMDGTYNTILGLNYLEADINDDGIAELIITGTDAGEKEPTNSYAIFYNLNDNNQDRGYYINNKHYQNWDAVPNQYKTAQNNSSSTKSSGLQIKL